MTESLSHSPRAAAGSNAGGVKRGQRQRGWPVMLRLPSGPQTASMKSFMIWSKKVEFQFVAGLLAVQSGGVSSGTTSRGFGHQGAKRTKEAFRFDSAS